MTVYITVWWLLWIYVAGLAVIVGAAIKTRPWAVSPKPKRRDHFAYWSKVLAWPAALVWAGVQSIKYKRRDKRNRINGTGRWAPSDEYWED